MFWWYVVASAFLACGFVDWGLLSFHYVDQAGMFAPQYIPLLYSIAMGVVGLTAFLCGRLFDRFGLNVLAIGILVTMLALPLGFLGGVTGAVLAAICWAAGHGVQDATLRAGIAQVVSMNKRGTAFGVFNAVYGVAWFAGQPRDGLALRSIAHRARRLRSRDADLCRGDLLLAAGSAARRC